LKWWWGAAGEMRPTETKHTMQSPKAMGRVLRLSCRVVSAPSSEFSSAPSNTRSANASKSPSNSIGAFAKNATRNLATFLTTQPFSTSSAFSAYGSGTSAGTNAQASAKPVVENLTAQAEQARQAAQAEQTKQTKKASSAKRTADSSKSAAKAAKAAKAATKTASAPSAKTSAKSSTKTATKKTGKPKTTEARRKRTIIALIAAVLSIDVVLATLFFLSGGFGVFGVGGNAKPIDDPTKLIQSQLINNHNQVIAQTGYDTTLTFEALGPQITSVNPRSLKPITNNFLAKVETGDQVQTILIDETTVGRLISFNAHLSSYLNQGDSAIFTDVLDNSKAKQFVTNLDGSRIETYRLGIGEIRRSGSRIYALAYPQYRLTKGAETTDVFYDVFLYKFVQQGNTLVLSDIEQIPNAVSSQGVSGAAGNAQTQAATEQAATEQAATEQAAAEQGAEAAKQD